MKEFKVIQIKKTEIDPRMFGESYEYVSKIILLGVKRMNAYISL